jgi:hypothetical protein
MIVQLEDNLFETGSKVEELLGKVLDMYASSDLSFRCCTWMAGQNVSQMQEKRNRKQPDPIIQSCALAKAQSSTLLHCAQQHAIIQDTRLDQS